MNVVPILAGRTIARPGQPYHIGDLQRRLGRQGHTVRTVVGLVRLLIETRDFPPPLGFRPFAGRLLTGAAAVTPKSLFGRDAVDAWFGNNDDTPAALSPAIAAAADRAAATRLDQAAARLAGAA